MSTIGNMRALAALGLATCEAEGIEPWEVLVQADRLNIAFAGTEAEADRLAVALGVGDVHRTSQDGNSGRTIYSVGSRAPQEEWHREQPEHFGASVPFDGRLVEVTVTTFVEAGE